MLLSDIILQSSEAALQLQLEDGSFPPGCNGPYHDQETPVRNTAHWLITMLKAYEISNEARFKDSSLNAVQYLLLPSHRPMNATFFCRNNPEKDFCNGLIGQAWVIEALAVAGLKLEDSQYFELAKRVFLMHPFDHKIGLWRRVNVDGSYATFDMAFNHQLWFATAGAILDRNSNNSINSEVERFLDRVLELHLRIDPSGRIIHRMAPPRISNSPSTLHRIKESIYSLRRQACLQKKNNQMEYKEIGYHAFNMYAFSMLKQRIPEHRLWYSDKFISALNYMNSVDFIDGLENNIYGYPYNPPGFEVAFSIQEFSPVFTSVKPVEWWVEQQLSRSYNRETNMMHQSTEDENTLAARLYESTRIKNLEIMIE